MNLQPRILLVLVLSTWLAVTHAQPANESDPSPEDITITQLMETISSWAGAWQSQLPDLYISHYTIDYIPPGFSSRKEWVENRRTRLLEPEYIKLRLIDFELHELTNSGATTRFKLIYERPGYSDETYKELVFQENNDLWLISEENNLEVKTL